MTEGTNLKLHFCFKTFFSMERFLPFLTCPPDNHKPALPPPLFIQTPQLPWVSVEREDSMLRLDWLLLGDRLAWWCLLSCLFSSAAVLLEYTSCICRGTRPCEAGSNQNRGSHALLVNSLFPFCVVTALIWLLVQTLFEQAFPFLPPPQSKACIVV